MRRRPLSSALLVTVAALGLMSAGLSGCSKPKAEPGDPHAEATGDHGGSDAEHGAARNDVAHWSYEGDDGPAHWGDLSTENKACKTGPRQSPINLSGVASPKAVNLTLDYTSSPAKIQNM